MSIMSETQISAITLVKEKDEFSSDEHITITATFSLTGGLRDSFTEKNWTQAYDENDNTIKLKYGIKLAKGGLRKHELGKSIDTYRKASIFWTRNPKLVNPMKERKRWHLAPKAPAKKMRCNPFQHFETSTPQGMAESIVFPTAETTELQNLKSRISYF